MTGIVAFAGRQRRAARELHLIQAGGGGNDDGMPPSVSLRVDHLEKDVAEIKGDVKALSSEVRTLSGDIKTISSDLKVLAGEVRTLSGEVTTLSGQVKAISGEVGKLWTDLAEVKGRVSMLPSAFQMQTWFVGVAIALVGMVFAIARLAK